MNMTDRVEKRRRAWKHGMYGKTPWWKVYWTSVSCCCRDHYVPKEPKIPKSLKPRSSL